MTKGYTSVLEKYRDLDAEKYAFLVMNFEENHAAQLKAIRVIEKYNSGQSAKEIVDLAQGDPEIFRSSTANTNELQNCSNHRNKYCSQLLQEQLMQKQKR